MREVLEDKLLVQLKSDYSEIRFRLGRKFAFRPPRTIIYEERSGAGQEGVENNYRLQLLHELGHAVLEHKSFATDLERLKMEVAAWGEARKFCEQYNIYYDEDFVEDQLDSYREWLHNKSRCAQCGLTRYQTGDGKYHCPGCEKM